MDRRDFLQAVGVAAGACVLPRWGNAADDAKSRPKRIMLVNCWHDINIGDQAHAPGMLQLIAKHLPGTHVTLWPYRTPGPEVRALLMQADPRLTILSEGKDQKEPDALQADVLAAMRETDLFIVGSGGYHGDILRMWPAVSNKPYGPYGVSITKVNHPDLLSNAAFVFCRDTISVEECKKAGVKSPHLEFCPDSTFGMTLRDDARADKYLAAVGLEPKKFICAIPRARYSPYPQIYNYAPSAEEQQKQRENDAHKVSDHAMLRDLIVHWVRQTGQKVLACPEMTYAIPLAKEQLVDPLPEDVKKNVVWRDMFWRCDEAASVYARSTAVVSMDCHSPIIALVNGTPTIHLRLPSDTTKSQMFADIGLKEWVHTTTDLTSEQLIKLTMAIYEQPDATQKKVAKAMAIVYERQTATMNILGRSLASA